MDLEKHIGDYSLAIEHVGSTSVAGLAAKPIIDLDLVIRDYRFFGSVKTNLEKLGYRHEGNLGIEDREAFCYEEKQKRGLMTHHLYVCPEYSNELRRHLLFRNYLRTHQDDVDKYSQIKRRAALNYPTDIEKYIEAKAPFINAIYKRIER